MRGDEYLGDSNRDYLELEEGESLVGHLVNINNTILDLDDISTIKPARWFEGYEYKDEEKERVVYRFLRKPLIEKYIETKEINKGYTPAVEITFKTGKEVTYHCDITTIEYHLKKAGLLW